MTEGRGDVSMVYTESVGDRIRQVRSVMGITQVKFAERIGISPSYVAELELGNRKPISRILRLICGEFRVNEHWLRTGDGSMYHKDASSNLQKAVSLFESLSPEAQKCALEQLNALADLYRAELRAED